MFRDTRDPNRVAPRWLVSLKEHFYPLVKPFKRVRFLPHTPNPPILAIPSHARYVKRRILSYLASLCNVCIAFKVKNRSRPIRGRKNRLRQKFKKPVGGTIRLCPKTPQKKIQPSRPQAVEKIFNKRLKGGCGVLVVELLNFLGILKFLIIIPQFQFPKKDWRPSCQGSASTNYFEKPTPVLNTLRSLLFWSISILRTRLAACVAVRDPSLPPSLKRAPPCIFKSP